MNAKEARGITDRYIENIIRRNEEKEHQLVELALMKIKENANQGKNKCIIDTDFGDGELNEAIKNRLDKLGYKTSIGTLSMEISW